MTGSAADVPSRLVVTAADGDSHAFVLSKANVTIGRAMTSDIVLRDDSVSRSHARIERTLDGYEVIDSGSANGVYVNGVVQSRASLRPGDVLTIGKSTLRFEAPAQDHAAGVTVVAPVDPQATVILSSPVAVHLEDDSLPALAVHTPARTWEVPLPADRLTIGRDPASDVVIEHPAVSRHHAVIEQTAGEIILRDLNSRNGTWIGDSRISRAVLHDADSAKIGPARLVLKRRAAVEDVAASTTRRPVVIVPGFAGSTLWHGDTQVWPTLWIRGLPDALRIDQPLEARAMVDEVVVIPNLIRLDQYGLLSGYLTEELGYEAGRDLLEFAYDFRQDNRESARRLAAAIDAWDVREPITIIAHSMGCLIARYFIERLEGRRKVERVILLGGPHAGAPFAFSGLITGPDLLPLGMMKHRLRDIIATFPSWYQILPNYHCVTCGSTSLEVLDDELWVAESLRPLLKRARQFRRELGRQSTVPAVCIFGYGFKTITGATVQRDVAGALTGAEFIEADAGDGTIPERSAVLRGADIHPVRQHHGSLFVDNDVQKRLKLELTRPR